MNTTNITNLSDNTLDALLAWKAGDEDFDFSMLTVNELRDLAACLPEVDFTVWILTAKLANPPLPVERSTVDYELLILEDDENYDPCAR